MVEMTMENINQTMLLQHKLLLAEVKTWVGMTPLLPMETMEIIGIKSLNILELGKLIPLPLEQDKAIHSLLIQNELTNRQLKLDDLVQLLLNKKIKDPPLVKRVLINLAPLINLAHLNQVHPHP